MNEETRMPETKEEWAEHYRLEQYADTDKGVMSVLYRVLMYSIYSVDVYDHKANLELHELIGFRDNRKLWSPANKEEKEALVGKYREPMNLEFDKLHNAFNATYPEIGKWMQLMKIGQLYAIADKIMSYDITKGFTEELSNIVGRKNLERVYRLAQ